MKTISAAKTCVFASRLAKFVPLTRFAGFCGLVLLYVGGPLLPEYSTCSAQSAARPLTQLDSSALPGLPNPNGLPAAETLPAPNEPSEIEELPAPSDATSGSQNAIRIDDGLIEDSPVRLANPLELEESNSDATEAAVSPEILTISDVVASVYRFYPEIEQARQQAPLAQGELTESYGAYDTKLKAHTLSEPTGFYENYRHGIGVARQTWWGGNVAAGYRIGRGVFQPWYLERETEQGGEFKVALNQPLLQGLAIDPQRVAVFRASLARRAADPVLQQAILDTSRDAMLAYWSWVAVGAVLQAQQDLLDLAETRGEQYRIGFEAGKFAEIDVVLNQQFIAERRGQAIEAARKFRESAFKLSMFLRDGSGNPLIPDEEWLPESFPVIEPMLETSVEDLISLALMQRPEPRLLQLQLQGLQLDRRLARNQLLPRLDFVVEGSQDIGGAASKSDDKGEFVLVIGAQGDVPIQRRKARGKLQSTAAKIAQVSQKLRLQQDKIGVEIRTSQSNLRLLFDVVAQAELALETAFDSLDRFRFAFDQGKIDLIYLNLLETKAFETEIKLIESKQKWFAELAVYQAAAGLDPIDRAGVVTQLPMSEPVGPPEPDEFDVNALESDWQRRIGEQDQP